MIPRYSRPEMVSIWAPETRFRIWFEIEAHAAAAMANAGTIPKEAAKVIWDKGSKATFDADRIAEIEAVTGLSSGNVAVRLTRARRRLTAQVNGEET